MRKGNKKYSANDRKLQRFLELQKEIKALTAELDELKDDIKEQGNFSSRHFIATVTKESRLQPPGVKALIKAYGPEAEKHCRIVEYSIVRVNKKEGK